MVDSIKPYYDFFISQLTSRATTILSPDSPPIEVLINYFDICSGKCIRPFLVLLSHQPDNWWTTTPSPSDLSTNLLDLALSIELIHLASLIHDDIIDGSILRRGLLSYPTRFGLHISVLYGDFLLSKAFSILSQINNSLIQQAISKASEDMCRGELLEAELWGSTTITVSDYYNIIRLKTSSLIAVSVRVGAILSNKPPEIVNSLEAYAENMGMAFQIVDDYLDFTGSTDRLGKDVMQDIQNGIFSLPLILLKNHIPNILSELKDSRLSYSELKDLLKKYNVLEDTIREAKSFVKKALRHIDNLPFPNLKRILSDIATFIVSRDH